MTNWLIYDCEIIRCIPPKGIEIDSLEIDFYRFGDGLAYCYGWEDYENMGVSVIGAKLIPREFMPDEIHQFINEADQIPHDFPEFQKLLKELNPIVIGFNSRKFDDRLMRENGITIKTDYDLLEEIRIAAYGSPRWEDQPRGFSYSLDRIARANGKAKTGSGSLAPELWQKGQQQEVIDYCLNDVEITTELLILGLSGGLIDPNSGDRLALRKVGKNGLYDLNPDDDLDDDLDDIPF